MLVEDSGKLKEWLVTELTNATIDADANAVALYAVALVKKELAEEELKPSICHDLSVFLAENTEPFVLKLIEAVRNKTYLKQPEESEGTQSEANNTQTTQNYESTESLSRQESKTQDSEPELSDEDRDHRRTTRRTRSRSNSPQHTRHRVSPHRRLGFNRGGGYRGGPRYPARELRRNMRSRPDRGYNDHNRRYDVPRRRSRSPRRSLSPRRRSRSPRDLPANRKSLSPVGRPRSPLDLLAAIDGKRDVVQKCRDYDEKGFCLRGELCPFPHGKDAVVMQGVTGLNLNNTSSNQPIKAGSAGPVSTIQPIISAVPPVPVEPYNPEVPRMWAPPVNQPRMPPGGYMMRPAGNLRYPGPPPARPPHHMPPMGPDFSRDYRQRFPPAGPPQRPPRNRAPPYNRPSATLEVKHLPAEINNISKLNEHFSKYGDIINLQVQYRNQLDTALVTFSNLQSAKSAYSDPKPLFDNRFIKVFWHQDNAQQGDNSRPSVKTRLGVEANLGVVKPAPKPRSEPNMNRSSLRLDNSAAKKAPPPAEVAKMRQSLIKELLGEQRKLLSLINETEEASKKSEYLTLLRNVNKKVEELQAANKALVSQGMRREMPQSSQAAKDLLDVEMDILQKTKAGEDTASLQKKLKALQKQAQSLGLHVQDQGGKASQHQSAPQQPTAISVTGFSVEEKDAVVSHFSQYGKVVVKEFVKEPKPLIIIEYSKPNDAKVAAKHGVLFGGGSRRLLLKWYKPESSTTSQKPAAALSAPATSVQPAAAGEAAKDSNARKPAASVSADSVLDEGEDLLAAGEGQEEGDIDEALLLGEEDADEDDSKRSW